MLHHHRFRVKALLLLPLPPTQRNRRGRQVLNRTFSSLIFFLCFSGTWTPKSTPKGGERAGVCLAVNFSRSPKAKSQNR